MLPTLTNNAYHVLGLDTSASEKEIFKRSKEIINRLKVDEIPSYDQDIGFFEGFRTEDTVKDALQRLQASKKRVKEYFFWFQIANAVDEEVLNLCKHKDYLDAIHTWENASQGQSAKAFFYKKNLAILYCLLLSTENNKDYLRSGLALWKELVDSDKFWNSFSKVYKLHDEQTASEDIIPDFKKRVVGYLSDLYTELHDIHKSSDYINEFQKVFSVKGEKIEKNLLEPAYHVINHVVEQLEKMEVSKDGKFDKEDSNSIKNVILTIQAELNKLIDLGLYDDSQTKMIRDRASNALRSISIDLHNKLNELGVSQGVLQVAIEFAGTESLKNTLQSELDQIQKNIESDEENSIAIRIPGILGGCAILFKNTYLEYDNKRIFYKDIVSITYHSESQSSHQSFSYMVTSETVNISFSFSALLHIGTESKKEIWIKLIQFSEGLIEPQIIKKLTDQIFVHEKSVIIGVIHFSKQGYTQVRTKLFGSGEKGTVYWTDAIYIPKFDAGRVVLWDAKGEPYSDVPMSIPNAVLIPELMKACVNQVQ